MTELNGKHKIKTGNKSLIIVSTLLSIFIIYIFLFIYTFFNFNNEFRYVFNTLENLNFHGELFIQKILDELSKYLL